MAKNLPTPPKTDLPHPKNSPSPNKGHLKTKENYKIAFVATETLKPYANNPRVHDAKQIALIANSIAEFGFTNPVLIDEENNIIAGHGRVLAAAKLKMTEVPCIVLSGLSSAQRRAYVIADNKIALGSGWNSELLRMELKELENISFDMSLTGFAPGELDHLLKFGAVTDGEDSTPEIPDNPITKTGDVWLLGPHRVICGDSTDEATVKKLLQVDKPNLMVTDPPYGVEYDASFRTRIVDPLSGRPKSARAIGMVLNDDRADWREAWALFPGSIAYVWHSGLHAGTVHESLQVENFKVRAQIIWVKNQIAIGRGDYHWQHEPCWYAVRGTGFWTGDRKQSTVWEIDKPQKSETGHSTQKPVECMRRPMLNNSSPGDFVYDPFLGSGTTVIAAETIGRACLGAELNPPYVDVIVKRWQDLTKKKAIHAETGKEFG